MIQLSTVQRLIRPVEVSESLRQDIQERQDHLFTLCPACGSALWILPRGFFCTCLDCPTGVWLVPQYIAAIRCSDMRDAAQWLAQVFHERIHNRVDDSADAVGFVKQAEHMAALLQFIRKRTKARTPDQLRTFNSLERFGLPVRDPRNSIFVVDKPDFEKLDRILMSINPDLRVLPESEGGSAFVPYFSDHVTIAGLKQVKPHNLQSRSFQLLDACATFSNLWAIGPETRFTCLHSSWEEALEYDRQWRLQDPRTASIGLEIDPRHTEEDLPWLPAPLFMQAEPVKSLWLAARTRQLYPGMKVALSSSRQVFGWAKFVTAQLLARLDRSGDMSTVGKHLLSQAGLTGGDRDQVIRELRVKGATRAAECVSRNLYDVEVYWSPRLRLYQTPDGYIARRTGQPAEIISNFTLDLTRNVIFPEHRTLYHEAMVTMGGHQLPITLASPVLDNPKDLQALISAAAVQRKLSILPMVRDQTAYKPVSHYHKSMIPRLTTDAGVPFLGWDFHKTIFYSAAWSASPDGFRMQSVHHPGIRQLDAFTNEPLPELPLTSHVVEALPSDVLELIAMIVATILRGRYDYPMRPVLIRHDRNAAAWVEAIFRGIGQQRALPRQTASEVPALRRYPAWTHSGVHSHNAISAEPVFVLASTGLPLTAEFAEEAGVQAGRLTQALVMRTCDLLFSSVTSDFTRQPHVQYSYELVEESGRFIRQRMRLPWPEFVPPFQTVTRLLQTHGADGIGDVMSYHFSEQLLYLDLDKSGQDPADLEAELRHLATTLKREGKLLKLDAYSGFALLEQFFARDVALPRISP